jgi:hypothetical protein
MWLLKAGRDTRRAKATLGAAFAVTAALALGGCSAAYVEGDTASVLLLIESIAEGTPLLSDVRGDSGEIVNCQVELTLTARAKNPIGPVGIAEDVRVQGYRVAYRRSDGRGAQGVDVPYTISGNTTTLVTAGTGSTDLSVDLVRHQAKLEPPLSNIVGLQVVTMFADITVFGQTVSGKAVSASGSTQVTFADYASGTSTCEG